VGPERERFVVIAVVVVAVDVGNRDEDKLESGIISAFSIIGDDSSSVGIDGASSAWVLRRSH